MEQRYKRKFKENKKLIEGNMAEFTVHANRNRDDTVTVYLSIHNNRVIAARDVDLHSNVYKNLFDYCKKILDK